MNFTCYFEFEQYYFCLRIICFAELNLLVINEMTRCILTALGNVVS